MAELLLPLLGVELVDDAAEASKIRLLTGGIILAEALHDWRLIAKSLTAAAPASSG